MSGGRAGSGAHFSVITAITISGCSLLLFALLHRKLSLKEAASSPSSGMARKKKKGQAVRFAEEVKDRRGSGTEYRARLRPRRRNTRTVEEGGIEHARNQGCPAEEPSERCRKRTVFGGGAAHPANRQALYRGLCQYRSQMATLMLYRT